LANRSVVLYLRTKIKKKWAYRKVAEVLSKLGCGEYYLSWYDGKRKRLDPAGSDPEAALNALQKKRLELAYVAAGGEVKQPDDKKGPEPAEVVAGGEVKQPDNQPTNNGEQETVSTAVKEYLEDCDDRQGKSGYGLAVRTPESYEYRLGFLIEFRPEARLDEVDIKFVRAFRRYLRKHKKDLGDRTCYNIMQAVSTFLLRFGNTAAKTILKEMSFPPTVVIPYSVSEMESFFAACTEVEELIFKFFLQSMARDMEVANCEVQDLKFDKSILHISPKPDRNFRLKGKRSGQAKNGRKLPIPAPFMARMQEYCKRKSPRDLLFTNGIGGVETHFLRRCKKIAKRAGLKNWKDFDLHRWRKTGATRHHENGVSVRKIQAWLGHESLDVTLAYLGVEDAADEISQEQVNNGALAAFV
jgi:integrase